MKKYMANLSTLQMREWRPRLSLGLLSLPAGWQKGTNQNLLLLSPLCFAKFHSLILTLAIGVSFVYHQGAGLLGKILLFAFCEIKVSQMENFQDQLMIIMHLINDLSNISASVFLCQGILGLTQANTQWKPMAANPKVIGSKLPAVLLITLL